MIYVSCGPQSLGRDLALLAAHGWKPDVIEPFDLMPGTAQVETIVFNSARFVGPMFAGLAIVWSGVEAAFAANALSYVVFLVALARIRVASTTIDSAKRLRLASPTS